MKGQSCKTMLSRSLRLCLKPRPKKTQMGLKIRRLLKSFLPVSELPNNPEERPRNFKKIPASEKSAIECYGKPKFAARCTNACALESCRLYSRRITRNSQF